MNRETQKAYRKWQQSGKSPGTRDLDMLLALNAMLIRQNLEPLYQSGAERLYISFNKKPNYIKGKEVERYGNIVRPEADLWIAFPANYDYEKNRWVVPSDYYDLSLEARLNDENNPDPKMYLGIGTYDGEIETEFELDYETIRNFEIIKTLNKKDIYHSDYYNEQDILWEEEPPVAEPVYFVYKKPNEDPEFLHNVLTSDKINQLMEGHDWNQIHLGDNIYMLFPEVIILPPEEALVPNKMLKDVKIFGHETAHFETSLIPNLHAWQTFVENHQRAGIEIDPQLVEYYEEYFSQDREPLNLLRHVLDIANQYNMKLNLFDPRSWPPYLGPVAVVTIRTKKHKYRHYPWPWNKHWAKEGGAPDGADFIDIPEDQVDKIYNFLNIMDYRDGDYPL